MIVGAVLGILASPLITAALYLLRALWRTARRAYSDWEWTALNSDLRRYRWTWTALHPYSLAYTAWLRATHHRSHR